MDFKRIFPNKSKGLSVVINTNSSVYVGERIPFLPTINVEFLKEKVLHLLVLTIPYTAYKECTDLSMITELCSHVGQRDFVSLRDRKILEFEEPGAYHVFFVLLNKYDQKTINSLLEKHSIKPNFYKDPILMQDILNNMIEGINIIGYYEELVVAFE